MKLSMNYFFSDDSKINKGYTFFLVVFVAIAIAIRLNHVNHSSIWPDEALYLFMGQNLSVDPLNLTDEHGHLFLKNPPAFVYVLALLFIFNPSEPLLIAHFLAIFIDIGIIVFTYIIAAKLFGRLVAVLSVGLLAVNPLHVWMSTRVLNDSLLTLFIYVAIALIIYHKRAAFFVCSILAVLTKYTAAPLFFIPFFNGPINRKNIWLLFSVYLFGIAGMVCIVWLKPQLSSLPGLAHYFTGFITLPNWNHLFHEFIFFIDVPVLLFFVIGLSQLLKKKQLTPLLLWIFIFGTIRLFLPWWTFRMTRYTLPLYPGLLIIAALGGTTCLKFLASRWQNRTTFFFVAFSAIFLYVMAVYAVRADTLSNINAATFIGFKEAGAALDTQKLNKRILTASPRQIKFFAPGYNVYDMPQWLSQKQALHLIRKKKIGYVAIDRWSPHQPKWANKYFNLKNGYRPIYQNGHIIICKVLET